jgi:uncharacterized damage-inducible protein DinB
VTFEVVDVMAQPDGMARLLAFGVRNVPVVAKGDKFVFGQVIADVAELVGVKAPGQVALAPAELVPKWLFVLEAAQRFVRQLPTAKLDERAVANRDRSVRYLAFHVFRIAEAFLEVTEGGEMTVERPNVPPGETMREGADIARYGAAVTARVSGWWQGRADKSCEERVPTYYGDQPLRDVLERCVWHSAQHVRQLMALLERWEIAIDTPVTDADLKGLPLPKGIWE